MEKERKTETRNEKTGDGPAKINASPSFDAILQLRNVRLGRGARRGNKKISANVEKQVTAGYSRQNPRHVCFYKPFRSRACDDAAGAGVQTHVAIIRTNLCRPRCQESLRERFDDSLCRNRWDPFTLSTSFSSDRLLLRVSYLSSAPHRLGRFD